MNTGDRLRLSVAVPTYNQAPFLRAALDSLLSQATPPHEIVVADDCSTDGTTAILATYGTRIRVVRPQHNLGNVRNWLYAVQHTTGDWVAILSSDDVALPNYSRVLLRGMARSENAVHVRAGWETIDAGGHKTGTRHLLSVKAVTRWPETLLEQRLGPKASFAAFAVRRDVWLAAAPILERVRHRGDWALWLAAAVEGDFVREREIIAQYRAGYDAEKTRRRLPAWLLDEFEIYRHIMPELAARRGMRETKWIRAAGAAKLRRWLAELSGQYGAEERAVLIPSLEAWAEWSGQGRVLASFARGQTVRDFHAGAFLRQVIRPVYQLAWAKINRVRL